LELMLKGPTRGVGSGEGRKSGGNGERKSYSGGSSGAVALTREEKRLQRDLRANGITAKPKISVSTPRPRSRLNNGRSNHSSNSNSSADSQLSARARITASVHQLTALNTEKRDMRSIDDIQRDIENRGRGSGKEVPKVISGTDAASFGDWFGKSKKEKEKEREEEAKRRKPQENERSSAERERERARKSLPGSSASKTGPSKSSPLHRSSKPQASTSSAKPNSLSRPLPPSKTPTSSRLPSNATRPGSAAPKKRSRSRSPSYDSFTESEDDRRPAKRRSEGGGGEGSALKDQIWAMFGRNRKRDLEKDVQSDEDEDMEACGEDLWREELRSARIAKKEDQEAEEEERRREEEKRRRKELAKAGKKGAY